MLMNLLPYQIVIIDGKDKTKEIEKIEILHSCIKIKFLRIAKIYIYNAARVIIKTNYYANPETQNIMKYFVAEASCSPIKIEGSDTSILKEYINRITQITDDIILSYYINKKSIQANKFNTSSLIYPFGINLSQKQAVENAFLYPLSIIQGPPGTGKTQTILNIIANALIQNKSIAVVSNNNSAVVNIIEKFKKYNLDFLLAMLGSKQNRETFIINQKEDYPEFNNFKSDENMFDLHNQITACLNEIKEILQKQNDLLILKQSKDDFLTEQKHFLKNYHSSETCQQLERMLLKLNSDKIFDIWSYCLNKDGLSQQFSDYIYFLFKFRLSFLWLKDKNIFKQVNLLQKAYYQKKLEELKTKITNLTSYLDNKDLNTKIAKLNNCSLKFLKSFLYKKLHGKKRTNFSIRDTSNISENFIKEYPVILSTLFSLKNSCQNGFVYDYLVVDEASQADLLTSVIAMSCAKNIIIVGDIKQLPNVITKEVQENSEKILQHYKVADVYKLYKHSLLSSILTLYPDAPNVLLREHYRCHPKIIGFCNNKYYQNELILYTQNNNEQDTLKAIKTSPGNHARGHINQRQIDIIKKEILPYLDKNLSIGIITPYRDQVNALRQNFNNIEIDTIHKFQGREKDIIILSTVDNNITSFIDNPNLINVAVSRAIKKFWIIYSNETDLLSSNLVDLINYIKYNNFEVIQSKVYSIFDLLYKRYTEERIKFLSKHPRVSQYASENIAYTCIQSCLKQIGNNALDVIYGLPLKRLIHIDNSFSNEEIQFISRDSHLDFLIYNKINKHPILAIEVNGRQHKENSAQIHRDEIKKGIMDKIQVELLPLPTDGSGEKELIINTLASLGITTSS